MLQGLTGPFTQFFTSAFTVAQPLIGGIGDLVRSILPQLAQVISSSAPAPHTPTTRPEPANNPRPAG